MCIISSYAVDMSNVDEVCSKQSQISSLIKQLSPSGQNATMSILKDIQLLSSAAYQIIFKKVKSQNAASFTRLNKTDPVNFKILTNFFDSKTNTDLTDVCESKKAEQALLTGFSEKNQSSVKYFLKQINDKYSAVLKHLATVVQTLNSDFVSQLMKNENMSLLASLAKLL